MMQNPITLFDCPIKYLSFHNVTDNWYESGIKFNY